METNENKNIDLSGYLDKSPKESASSASGGGSSQSRKKKTQITIIIVCAILAAVFWGYIFYQNTSETRIPAGQSEQFIP